MAAYASGGRGWLACSWICAPALHVRSFRGYVVWGREQRLRKVKLSRSQTSLELIDHHPLFKSGNDYFFCPGRDEHYVNSPSQPGSGHALVMYSVLCTGQDLSMPLYCLCRTWFDFYAPETTIDTIDLYQSEMRHVNGTELATELNAFQVPPGSLRT